MNLGKCTSNNVKILAGNATQGTHSSATWQSELRQLIKQGFADGSVQQFLLSLAKLMAKWRGLSSKTSKRNAINAQPTTDYLPDLLRRYAKSLKDKNQKQYLLFLINEVVKLLNYQQQSLVWKFKYQYLSYLANCEKMKQKECTPLMRVITADVSCANYQFPLNLTVFGNDGKNTTINQNSIVIDQQEHKLEQKTQLFQLNGTKDIIINMKLSGVKYVGFTDCYRILSVDISQTFIRHIDIRQLISLESLQLNNTNIRRLDLANQRMLKILNCGYTFIDHLQVSEKLYLKELDIAFAGQLRLNRMGVRCKVSHGEQQTIDSYQCKSEIKKMMESYVISYPQMRKNENEITIKIPEQCNALIDRSIKQCKKVKIHGADKDNINAIDTFSIAEYPNLEELHIKCLHCKCFFIFNLPALAVIDIWCVTISSICIANFPNLREIQCTFCSCLKQFSIEQCEQVETLHVNDTKISRLDCSELRELLELDISSTNIACFNVSRNTHLEELNVAGAKIAQLNMSQLTELKSLDIRDSNLTELDVSRNVKLEDLCANNTKASRLNIRQLTELRKLWIHKTNISQLDVSNNTNLEVLDISDTKLCELDVRKLRKLQELRVSSTSIKQLDVSANAELKVLYAFNTSIAQINVSRNMHLEELYVQDTKVSQLDVSQLADLKTLDVSHTAITQIDVTRNTELEELRVYGTKIFQLNVSQLKQLRELQIFKTAIGHIDLSNNSQLIRIVTSKKCEVLNCCCEVCIYG